MEYPHYQRGTDPWYIWAFSPAWDWVLSPGLGVFNGINPVWLGPVKPEGPAGTYWPEDPAVGTATVAFP